MQISNKNHNVTRGNGLLEPFLARMRAGKANSLIPDHLRKGRILDIGCGSYPYFLSHTYFEEKYAIDQHEKPDDSYVINWYKIDLNSEPHMPFDGQYFSAVTMLAVAEHLNPSSLVKIFQEIHRVLVPDGMLVVTTPAAWSDSFLHLLSRLKMVSKEEIDEHIYVYTLPLLGWYFGKAGFEMTRVKFGYFEFHMNLWAAAYR